MFEGFGVLWGGGCRLYHWRFTGLFSFTVQVVFDYKDTARRGIDC